MHKYVTIDYLKKNQKKKKNTMKYKTNATQI